MADRPTDPALDRDFARDNGWDADFETYSDFDLPTYVGPTTFMNLPWVTDPRNFAASASMSRSSVPRSTTRSATGRAPASGRAPSGKPSTPRARSTRSSSTSIRTTS